MLAIGAGSFANAQTNALGLRFNSGYGAGLEASYQRFLSDANRLEAGLGLGVNEGFRANVVYQWVWDLSQLADGFKWYAGAGGGLILYQDEAYIGALGNLGIEFNFKIPLQLSFDVRPGFYLLKDAYFGWGGAAFGVRYKF